MLDPSLIYYRNSFSKAEEVVNIQKKNQHWPIQITINGLQKPQVLKDMAFKDVLLI